jgi:hypothetical protein
VVLLVTDTGQDTDLIKDTVSEQLQTLEDIINSNTQ